MSAKLFIHGHFLISGWTKERRKNIGPSGWRGERGYARGYPRGYPREEKLAFLKRINIKTEVKTNDAQFMVIWGTAIPQFPIVILLK